MKKILPDRESSRGLSAPQPSILSTELQPHSYSNYEKLFIQLKNVKNHAADLGPVLVNTYLSSQLSMPTMNNEAHLAPASF